MGGLEKRRGRGGAVGGAAWEGVSANMPASSHRGTWIRDGKKPVSQVQFRIRWSERSLAGDSLGPKKFSIRGGVEFPRENPIAAAGKAGAGFIP